MSAIDILEKLEGVEAYSLEPLQRVLLITDGTLTEILEAMFLERIRLIKVFQQSISAAAAPARLAPDPKETLLERKIILQGIKSNRNYVYAESVIAIERFDPLFRDALLNSDIPLGRLWVEHKLETYKELLDVRCQRANDLCQYFKCEASTLLLVRTYCVFSAAKPVMIISKHFLAE
jgi:chorismate-pyruvate lyase